MNGTITADQLRLDGIARVTGIDPGAAAVLVDDLISRPVWNAHVIAKATEHPRYCFQMLGARLWPMFCHHPSDVLRLPGFFELALATRGIAEAYFEGERPLLYSVNAFWTQPVPGAPPYLDTHGWHRDGDDRRQLALFLFGTRVVAPEEGAHLYQRGTHVRPDSALGRDFRAPPPSEVETITGDAGTAFLADPGGLHLGLRPASQPRLLFWARWGVSDPPQSYAWDRLAPAPRSVLGDRYPADPVLQDAIRLVVA